MSDAPLPASRLPGLDAIKGLAILCVVAIHAVPTNAPAWTEHGVNGVARLAVPLFLVVTGYLSGRRATPRGAFRGLFFKFLRLHLIYGLFYWAITVLRTGSAGALTLKGIVLHFAEAAYPGQFYFVILLQITFVGAFLLPIRWLSDGRVVALAALLSFVTLPLPHLSHSLFVAEGPIALARPVAASASMLWLWLHYFTFGAWLGKRGTSAEPSTPLGACLLALAAGIALLGWPAAEWDDPLIGPYARASIWLGATLGAVAVAQLARWEAPAALRRIGRESFGIFVLNPALLMLSVAAVGAPEGVAASLLHTAVALACAYALTLGLRRYAPQLLA